jgi:hypothetical protein
MQEMRETPVINPKSEAMTLGKSGMKVEDRLLNIGKMWKERKEKLSQDLPEAYPHQPTTLSSFRSQQVLKEHKHGSYKSFEQRVKD